MEPNETLNPAASESHIEVANATPSPTSLGGIVPFSQPERGNCPTCGSGVASMPVAYVYAVGRIEWRYPTLGVEKEFAQARHNVQTAGLTDRQAFYEVLNQNRYLARQLCWVFTIKDVDTYILRPHDPTDLNLLIESVRRDPSPMDVDVVIGVRGLIAPPEMCNGLMVPIIVFDQLYSFTRDLLVAEIKRKRKEIVEDLLQAASGELFERIMKMLDNAGATDEHRALNYLAVRYDEIYVKTAEYHLRDFSLKGVEVRPSPLSGSRKIVDAIFSYANRLTDVTEKQFVRVDVTEEFPFPVTPMSEYFDR